MKINRYLFCISLDLHYLCKNITNNPRLWQQLRNIVIRQWGVFSFKALRTLPLIFFIALLSASCEKEFTRYPEIQAYHAESLNLYVASADSVGNFSQKVQAFVVHHPDATQDPLYPVIQQNIRQNLLRLHITINDDWDGETTIEFWKLIDIRHVVVTWRLLICR